MRGRCNGEVVCQARTASVCANGSINHHYSTEPPHSVVVRKYSKSGNYYTLTFILQWVNQSQHTIIVCTLAESHRSLYLRPHLFQFACFMLLRDTRGKRI